MGWKYTLKRLWEREHLAAIGRRVVVHWSVRMSGHKSIRIEDDARILNGVSLEGNVRIGQRTSILQNCIIAAWGGSVVLGDDCSVNPFSVLYGHGGLVIGNQVLIGAHVTMIPANHDFSRMDLPIHQQGINCQGITIEDDVWIGSGARILDGAYIGRGSVIGAGAVVVCGRIPPYSVAVGVPARVIKNRKDLSAHEQPVSG